MANILLNLPLDQTNPYRGILFRLAQAVGLTWLSMIRQMTFTPMSLSTTLFNHLMMMRKQQLLPYQLKDGHAENPSQGQEGRDDVSRAGEELSTSLPSLPSYPQQ